MEKSLKKLNRRELLELLLRVTENNEALMAENAELRENSQARLSQSAKVGSIAQAALEANGYFEAAQNAADDYLREIRWLRDQMAARYENEAARRGEQVVASQPFDRIKEQAQAYIQDVQNYANNVIVQANAQAESTLAEAQEQSSQIVARTNEQARAFVERVNAKGATVIEDAKAKAQAIVDDANTQAKGIVDDANAQAADILAKAAEASVQAPGGDYRGRIGQVAQEASAAMAEAGRAVIALLSSTAHHADPSSTGQIFARGRHARVAGGAGA